MNETFGWNRFSYLFLRSRGLLRACVVIAFALSVSNADAQEANDAPNLSEARAAFLEGMDFMKEQAWEKARDRFMYAASARRTPGLLYYAAYCLEQQGRYAEALEVYQEAQDLIDHVAAADVEALLPQAIARVDAEVAQVRLLDVPKEARIRVDGQLRERNERNVLRLDPGRHTIDLQSENHEPVHLELEVKAGVEETVAAPMKPLEPRPSVEPIDAAAEPIATPRSASTTPVAKPYVVGAASVVALAGLGVGIYATVRRSDHRSQSQDLGYEIDDLSGGNSSSCADPGAAWANQCSELSDSLRKERRANTMMIVGYTTFGVAAVGAVLAQTLWKRTPVEVALLKGGAFVAFGGRF